MLVPMLWRERSLPKLVCVVERRDGRSKENMKFRSSKVRSELSRSSSGTLEAMLGLPHNLLTNPCSSSPQLHSPFVIIFLKLDDEVRDMVKVRHVPARMV